MSFPVPSIQYLVLSILCLSAIWYYCYGIYAARKFFSEATPIDPNFHPPITILKPICGLDVDSYENFASFCQQDYPEYQIVFCVREQHDPSVEIVKKIIDDFPQVDICLVVSDRLIGANFKVNNLANAVTKAKHDIFIVADSDIRVGSDYLQKVIQPMHDKNVGVVTCLYTSVVRGWMGILEAIATACDFHAGVLVSRELQGIKFAFGSTIVIRAEVLAKIGGFEAMADYLADDYQLGYLPAQAGYKVVLSDYVVQHVLPNTTLSDFISRQIRWARCIRVSQPYGYLGLIFSYGIVSSLLFLIVTRGSIIGWAVLIVTWLTRFLMGWVVGVKSLGDTTAKNFLWLIPIRDIISFIIWCCGFVGNTINWRGRRLKLIKGGKLELL